MARPYLPLLAKPPPSIHAAVWIAAGQLGSALTAGTIYCASLPGVMNLLGLDQTDPYVAA
jgi:hypothetical protein